MGRLNDRKDVTTRQVLTLFIVALSSAFLPPLAVSFVTVKRQMNDNGKQAQRDFDEISVDVHAALHSRIQRFRFSFFVPEHPAIYETRIK